ncbi:helix-turn-helix domain-containing protein [Streptomyces millisiae]|uniref:Helix-turn-helix transcriptional regulator n=1 Tax=Streptomyces millisiae TaxID=3075542 RepID=A0ABU2LQ18_9ACTN|nr:helix-turn-helix transcriptional regulator [Streptomyces sp. DSM 44918]MDT0319681.1 helix-turn-helix transcriptional regulator [Streptomyces sp. DSM 44918]
MSAWVNEYGDASPTYQFVALLVRTLREANGWTQDELGSETGYTGSAISALERCAQPPSEVKLAKLDEALFGGKKVLRAAQEYMRMDRYPRHFKNYAKLEMAALSICSYETLVIDGLFQTEEYARAVIECGYPPRDPEEADTLVRGRIDRKTLFDRKPLPLLELILEESALRRQVGTPEVMRRQLNYLIEQAQRINVTLQVLPLRRGATGQHAGLRGSMKVLETSEHQTVIYLETGGESILLSEPGKVTEFAQRYAKIRAQALSQDESLAFIEQLAEEWE